MAIALKKENVVDIRQDYITKDLEVFLENCKSNSLATYKNYKGDLKQFFKMMYDKEPQFVTVDDLINTNGNHMVEYRNELRNMYSSTSTVNRKINCMRSFFKYMETDYPEIRSSIFNKTKNLKQLDEKGYGVLTYEEVMSMIELSKTYVEGKELSLLIELAFATGIRLSALLDLKWSNFNEKYEHGKKINVIEVIDKSEVHKKAISDTLMEKVNSMKMFDSLEEKLFKTLYDKKVGKYIARLCKELNIDEKRNIKFHSLKKASINHVYDITGDIMMAQKQGNHKSPSTTIKSYMAHKEELSAMPSYTITDGIDISELEELSKEELIKLIANSSASTKLELLRRNQQ